MPRLVYRFGDCTIDASARELRQRGALATLSPKVFDCLIYLIQHRDRAVGRDELIAAVWGKTDVTDTLLGQTILKARRAVGDSGNGQSVIRTVPRFGYRWVATLAEVDADTTAGDRASPPPKSNDAASIDAHVADATPDAALAASADAANTPTARRRIGPIAIATFAIAVVVVVAAAMLLQRTRPQSPVAAPMLTNASAVASAAVLPVTVSAGDEWSWLRLGLMDLIAARLRQAGQPIVPSDNVVALLRAGDAQASASASDDATQQALRDASGARWIVVPRVARGAKGWNVDIELRAADGSRREIDAQGPDPIDTARLASDRLLALLGRVPPADRDGTATLSLAELEQRTEAALLSDDFVSARKLIETAAPALRDAPVMRLRLGQIEFRSGQLAASRTTLEALLGIASAESDPILRARALYTLGGVALRQDRNDDAIRAFSEAIALTATRDEPFVLGQAYTGLAAAEVNAGAFDAAADDLGRARVAIELAGDTLQLARIDANEGVLDNARGRPAEALPILKRAADRFTQFGALNELFLTVAAEMKAHLALLDAASALAVSEPVWAVREKLDNPGARTAFELQRARALAAAGRLTAARTLLDALGRASPPDATGLPGDIASERARMHLASGDADAAVESARVAVARLPTVDEARERARAWLTWTRALRAANRLDDARREADALSRWAATHATMPSVTLFASLAEAEQARADARRDDEAKHYAAALADAERWAVPSDLAAVAMSYGGSLIAETDFEHASAVIGRVARWADRDFDCALLQARLYHALGQKATWQTALTRARSLAGERVIPAALAEMPGGVRVSS